MPSVKVDGEAQLFYADVGRGRPLIFVHGWCMTHAIWMYQLEALSDRYRVLAVDLRGHGRSDWTGPFRIEQHAQDVRRLIEALNLSDVALFGWSMGSFVATQVATMLPEQITHLGLVGGSARVLADDGYPAIYTRDDLENLARALRNDFPGSARSMAARCFAPGFNPAAVEWFAQLALSTPLWVTIEELHSIGATDNRRLLPGLRQPTIIFHGPHDGFNPQAQGEYLRAHIPNAHWEFFPSCGHSPMVEDPARFNDLVRAFVG